MEAELRAARLGKLTASMAGVIMGALETDGLKRYIRRLAGERLFGDLGEDGFQSEAMKRGTALESVALDIYASAQRVDLVRGAHIDHPELPMVAATPDAMIPGVRIVEVKSPLFTTWAETKERRVIPSEYRWQVRWQMWCAELSQADFVSYHPKAGIVILRMLLEKQDAQLMRERAELVNGRVQQWMDALR